MNQEPKLIELYRFNAFHGVLEYAVANGYIDFLDSKKAIAFDSEYFYGRSGDKNLSALSERFCSNIKTGIEVIDDVGRLVVDADGNLVVYSEESESEIQKLWELVCNRYCSKWQRLSDILNIEYNPIDNIKWSETTSTDTGTVKSHSKDTSSSANDSIYGFNSTSAVPSGEGESKSSESGESSGKTTKEFIRTMQGKTDKYASKSYTNLIDNEFALRERQLIDTIFKDMDEMLASRLYR